MKVSISIRSISLLFFSLIIFQTTAQKSNIKILKATRIHNAPKIDGIADDVQWQNVPEASGFYMFAPGDGDPLPAAFDTKVKVVYDNVAVYILAEMNDPQPTNISKIFGLRDQQVQADHFSVILNPFITPNNNYLFRVYASGAQLDGMYQRDKRRQDVSWNAVWKSATRITTKGWVVEMAIPYSALRFQNEDSQTWAIGFMRHIDRKREDYSWTYIDKTKTGDMVQFLGRLSNLNHLKPPVRLSLYPYTSAVHTRFDGDNQTNFGFGMDLKYGLSESYTLDATLIPDFSDTPYDELVLNLGPFEQYYQEKRQFFTEGFDLFNKGHLFYSRRIGGRPTDYSGVYGDLSPDETIVENPDKVQLINALKISGRSKNGLGIGFFNAITNETKAIIKNMTTGQEREYVTEPYANYNVFVMDYNFKGNSSVSFINTNVIRQGSFRDANVTGIYTNLYGQKNTMKVIAGGALSIIHDNDEYTKGIKYYFKASKRIKQHGFEVYMRGKDDKYNGNDLGFSRNNNYAKFDVSYSYSILKPTKHFNSLHLSFDAGFDRRFVKLAKIQNDYTLNGFFTNKKYLSYGFELQYVTDAYDYYEPRVPGRYFLDTSYGGGEVFVSSDYRKKFAYDVKLAHFIKFKERQNYTHLVLAPRFRFSNRFNMQYQFEFSKMYNGKGFVDLSGEKIIFGRRRQETYTNSLAANYFFNTKSALNLSARYYWAPVHYNAFYELNQDGILIPIDYYHENRDINYSVWNLDFGYSWEFAPGSNLTVLYRNTLTNLDNLSLLSFGQNIENLTNQPAKHSFIIKMTYYLDYNTIKNKWL